MLCEVFKTEVKFEIGPGVAFSALKIGITIELSGQHRILLFDCSIEWQPHSHGDGRGRVRRRFESYLVLADCSQTAVTTRFTVDVLVLLWTVDRITLFELLSSGYGDCRSS